MCLKSQVSTSITTRMVRSTEELFATEKMAAAAVGWRLECRCQRRSGSCRGCAWRATWSQRWATRCRRRWFVSWFRVDSVTKSRSVFLHQDAHCWHHCRHTMLHNRHCSQTSAGSGIGRGRSTVHEYLAAGHWPAKQVMCGVKMGDLETSHRAAQRPSAKHVINTHLAIHRHRQRHGHTPHSCLSKMGLPDPQQVPGPIGPLGPLCHDRAANG